MNLFGGNCGCGCEQKCCNSSCDVLWLIILLNIIGSCGCGCGQRDNNCGCGIQMDFCTLLLLMLFFGCGKQC